MSFRVRPSSEWPGGRALRATPPASQLARKGRRRGMADPRSRTRRSMDSAGNSLAGRRGPGRRGEADRSNLGRTLQPTSSSFGHRFVSDADRPVEGGRPKASPGLPLGHRVCLWSAIDPGPSGESRMVRAPVHSESTVSLVTDRPRTSRLSEIPRPGGLASPRAAAGMPVAPSHCSGSDCRLSRNRGLIRQLEDLDGEHPGLENGNQEAGQGHGNEPV